MGTVKEVFSELVLPELPRLHNAVSFKPALRHLQKQRTETAALRGLWQSFSEKRSRTHDDLRYSKLPSDCLRKSSEQLANHHDDNIPIKVTVTATRQPIKVTVKATHQPIESCIEEEEEEDVTFKPVKDHAEIAAEKVTDEEHVQSARQTSAFPPVSTAQVNGVTLGQQRQNHSATDVTSRFNADVSLALSRLVLPEGNIRHEDDVKSPQVPYHTAITQRPERRAHNGPRYQALTQSYTSPLPHLMEQPGSRSRTAKPLGARVSKRDIREWQNEVVKVVPSRPDFVQALPQQFLPSSVTNWRYPFKVLHNAPLCHFYRSWSKATLRDFVIDPEWCSEKRRLASGKESRAATGHSLPK